MKLTFFYILQKKITTLIKIKILTHIIIKLTNLLGMKMMYLSTCLNIGRSTCKQPWDEGAYLAGRRNKGEEEDGFREVRKEERLKRAKWRCGWQPRRSRGEEMGGKKERQGGFSPSLPMTPAPRRSLGEQHSVGHT